MCVVVNRQENQKIKNNLNTYCECSISSRSVNKNGINSNLFSFVAILFSSINSLGDSVIENHVSRAFSKAVRTIDDLTKKKIIIKDINKRKKKICFHIKKSNLVMNKFDYCL